VDLSIPGELLELQRVARTFVSRELAPLEEQVDRDDDVDPATMLELRLKAASIGLCGFNIPSQLGGGGIGPLGEVLIGEEIGRTSMPLAEAIGRIPRSLVYASSAQRHWLLKPAIKGEKTACIALTEPNAGSDLQGVQTRAVRDGDVWRLTGSKQFISNAETSDFVIVLAVTEPNAPIRRRFTTFVVDRQNPGLTITRRFRKMGWRGYHISAFSLDDCKVPSDRVLGDVGGGFDTIMESVNTTRLYIAARCVGAAQELLRRSVEYAVTRRTFGSRLGDHQAIQFMLANMDVELEAARLLVLAAAWKGEKNAPDFRISVSRAKLYATEMAGRVADSAVQIFGGSGYMSDLPVERMYRDLRGFRIGEGSSEMQRIQIARHLLARR
jgi:alkylation response protein AidB-like acyl-CoA dehydrogenase